MLLFISFLIVLMSLKRSFNTSHVVIYRVKQFLSVKQNHVSIHLMLLFISKRTETASIHAGFNTSHVVIYLPSYHFSSLYKDCFNTSHVVIYLPDWVKWLSTLCCFNTSHVVIYRYYFLSHIR